MHVTPTYKPNKLANSFFRPDAGNFFGPNRADRSRIFQKEFHLGRIPWLTLALILALLLIYLFWQPPGQQSLETLLLSGARHPVLFFEAGQWWRLFSSNFIHMSSWHLVLNLIFLLHLGGPAESIFHRRDYSLLLLGSAAISSLISSLVESQISCGASGAIFGIWGACSVFGIRFRDFLPLRYKRYFIGIVIPYALVALYMGFSFKGIDNWAHLGGLLAGILLGLSFKPRVLGFSKSTLSRVLILFIILGTLVAQLTTPSYLDLERRAASSSTVGASLMIPRGWENSYEKFTPKVQTFAHDNALGVGVGLELKELQSPLSRQSLVRDFIANELEDYLSQRDLIGVTLQESQSVTLDDFQLDRISTRTKEHEQISRSDYFLGLYFSHRVIVSFHAPDWLWATYEPTFERIISNLQCKSIIEDE